MRPRHVITLAVIALAVAGCMRRQPVNVAVPASVLARPTGYTAPALRHTRQGLPLAALFAPRPRAVYVAAAPVVVAAPVAPAPVVVAAAPVYAGRVVVAPARVEVAYAAAEFFSDPGPYRLGAGDRLRVVVFGQEGLSNTYAVDPSGSITMPLIGTLQARGLTADELAHTITARLKKNFIREPYVAVEIEAYRPFFILGEVTAPGQYQYVANMTVETAVAIAGGFAPRAYRKTVQLTRLINGHPIRVTVPVTATVRPGDTINIPERWF